MNHRATLLYGAVLMLLVSVVHAATVVVAAAGDIQGGTWSAEKDFERTAALVEMIKPDFVFGLGDLSNSSGREADYAEFDKGWGRFKAKILAVPGSHDAYGSGGEKIDRRGVFFYDYFNGRGSRDGIPAAGAHTGPRDQGYWSRQVGDWLVIGLNYCVSADHKFAADDAQCQWLDAVLKAKPRGMPVVVLEHVPRYTRCPKHVADESKVSFAWNVLMKYKPDVKLFLCGHQNGVYERFTAMDNAGNADPNGIVSFTVGTGGVGKYPAGTTNSLLLKTAGEGVRGVLKLILRANGYDYEFVPAPGVALSDAGSVTWAPASGT